MAGVLRVPLSDLREGKVVLADAAARYVTRVHRLKDGDAFLAFDPEAGVEADARVTSALQGEVTLGAVRPSSALAPRPVAVVQCLAKGDKVDAIVRDATELGATWFVPAVSERSIALHSGPRAVERWRRIAVEAARQSLRGDVPTIDAPRSLDEALQAVVSAGFPRRLVLAPAAAGQAREALGSRVSEGLAVVIGPEGGLSDAELAACAAHGFAPVQLGRFVLRTETACAAVLGAALALATD